MGTMWRKIATPVTLICLLAILGYGLVWGYRELTRPPRIAAPQPCVMQAATELNASQVKVKVFNGGTVSGRASQIAKQLDMKGFNVAGAANTNENVTGTTIVGSTEVDPAVALVAAFFPESTLKGDGRIDGSIDILVGDNFAGFKHDAPTTIDVPAGEICLPATSASPSAEAEKSAEQTGEEGDQPSQGEQHEG